MKVKKYSTTFVLRYFYCGLFTFTDSDFNPIPELSNWDGSVSQCYNVAMRIRQCK